jgi:hypothetical protein
MTSTRLCCVTYTDRNSIKNQAAEDLILGHTERVVACNAKAFGASVPGDRVIITAKRGATRLFVIALIKERLLNCYLWRDHGGLSWEHAFLYEPLTEILELTPAHEAVIAAAAARHFRNKNNLFHARFCSALMNPVLDELLAALKS